MFQNHSDLLLWSWKITSVFTFERASHFGKKSNWSFSAVDNFHSSVPHLGELEFDSRGFCLPITPTFSLFLLWISLLSSLSLISVVSRCCCIGGIPTSFILRSPPHTHPSRSPLGVIFPPFLTFSYGGLERPRPRRICPVVAGTADRTDWGFAVKTYLLSCGRRGVLIKCNIPEGHILPVVTPTWKWCLLITTITLPLWFILWLHLFLSPHFSKMLILANTCRKRSSLHFSTSVSSSMSLLLLCSSMSWWDVARRLEDLEFFEQIIKPPSSMRLLQFYIFLNHFFSSKCDSINDTLYKQISFFLILHKHLRSYFIRRLWAFDFTLKLA